MVKYSVLFIVILILSSCSRKQNEFLLESMDYDGNEIRIDGYYFVETENFEEKQNSIYFFYRNGIVLYGGTISQQADLEEYALSLSEEANAQALKGDLSGWGVFVVNSENIDIETWEAGGPPIKTVVRSGKNIDQKTFIITSFLNNYNGETSTRNDTFYFKEFSPKPDSTNVFIK